MGTGREKRDALVKAGLTPDEGAYMLLAMGEISRVEHAELLSEEERERAYGPRESRRTRARRTGRPIAVVLGITVGLLIVAWIVLGIVAWLVGDLSRSQIYWPGVAILAGWALFVWIAGSMMRRASPNQPPAQYRPTHESRPRRRGLSFCSNLMVELSPLPDSNRKPPPYEGRTSRTRVSTRGHGWTRVTVRGQPRVPVLYPRYVVES
jgi:hypothetical protein